MLVCVFVCLFLMPLTETIMSSVRSGAPAGCRFSQVLLACCCCFFKEWFLFSSSQSLKRSGLHIWIRAQQLPDGGGGSAESQRPQLGSQLGSLHSCGSSDSNLSHGSVPLSSRTELKTPLVFLNKKTKQERMNF